MYITEVNCHDFAIFVLQPQPSFSIKPKQSSIDRSAVLTLHEHPLSLEGQARFPGPEETFCAKFRAPDEHSLQDIM